MPRGYSVEALENSVPRHIGIIMDGNGRWARRRGHPASFGHRAGVRAIKRVLEGCEQLGVEVLSVYAFSTENWSRPRAEVRALMRLFHETMQRRSTRCTAAGCASSSVVAEMAFRRACAIASKRRWRARRGTRMASSTFV